MNKILLSAVVAVAALGAGGWYWYTHMRGVARIANIEAEVAVMPAAATAEGQAAAEQWKGARDGMALFDGDVVQTGARSTALIAFHAGAEIKLGARSKLLIQSVGLDQQANRRDVSLTSGRIDYDTLKINGAPLKIGAGRDLVVDVSESRGSIEPTVDGGVALELQEGTARVEAGEKTVAVQRGDKGETKVEMRNDDGLKLAVRKGEADVSIGEQKIELEENEAVMLSQSASTDGTSERVELVEFSLPASPTVGVVPEETSDHLIRQGAFQLSWMPVTQAISGYVVTYHRADQSMQAVTFEPTYKTTLNPKRLTTGSWFWTARALSIEGIAGAASIPRPLIVYSYEGITPPSLLAPAPGTEMTQRTRVQARTLKWRSQIEKKPVLLQISTDKGFAPARMVFSDLTTQSSQVLELAQGTYFWRMASFRGLSVQGPFSGVASFSVRKIFEPSLMLTAPGRFLLTYDKTVLVQGRTEGGNEVVVSQMWGDDLRLRASGNGRFETQVPLTPGENLITVTVRNRDGLNSNLVHQVVSLPSDAMSKANQINKLQKEFDLLNEQFIRVYKQLSELRKDANLAEGEAIGDDLMGSLLQRQDKLEQQTSELGERARRFYQ